MARAILVFFALGVLVTILTVYLIDDSGDISLNNHHDSAGDKISTSLESEPTESITSRDTTETIDMALQAGKQEVPSRHNGTSFGWTLRMQGSETLLNLAVRAGDYDAVAALLDAGADVNAWGKGGMTPLANAAAIGDHKIVELLVSRGADPSLGAGKSRRSDVSTTENHQGQFSSDDLPEAQSRKESDPFRPSKQVDAMQKRAQGQSLDEESRSKLSRDLLLSTVGDGASDNSLAARDTDRRDSLTEPDGRSSSIETLETRAEIQQKEGVASVASKDASDTTLKQGTLPDGIIERSSLPIIVAAENGHVSVVDILLEAGADKNAADSAGTTPLIAASRAGKTETVALLLDRGADVSAADNQGRVALDIARENDRTDIVRLILDQDEPAAREKVLEQEHRESARQEQARQEEEARVSSAQRLLLATGYNPGSVDGLFGRQTKTAVRAFQRDHGMKVDGEITDALLNLLEEETKAREVKPKPAPTPPPKQAKKQAKKQVTKKEFFTTLFGEFQKLRGLRFNSVEDPTTISKYCSANEETWLYDEGTRDLVLCKRFLRQQ